MKNSIKSISMILAVLTISPLAFADPHDWQVSVVCDAVKREARVEMERCDYEVGCEPKGQQKFGNGRGVMAGTDASRQLYTGRYDEMLFIKNSPQEYGCGFENIASSDDSFGEPSVFLRVERFPSNWNIQGRCGAAPNQVKVSIQVHTKSLDMTRSLETIAMAGDCGWGDEGPISKIIVNADNGKISKVKYSADDGP